MKPLLYILLALLPLAAVAPKRIPSSRPALYVCRVWNCETQRVCWVANVPVEDVQEPEQLFAKCVGCGEVTSHRQGTVDEYRAWRGVRMDKN